MADRVRIRNEQGFEREVAKTALPYFVSQGYVALTSDGRVNSKATSTASSNDKEK